MPEFKQFKLPDIGEGLPDGEILRWMVKPGDEVVINQPIVEIETAKVAVELPCPYAGIVTELHFPEGSTVDVGAPIITIDVDPGGAPAAAPVAPVAAAPANGALAGRPAGGPYAGAVPSSESLAQVAVTDESQVDAPEAMLVGYGPKVTEAKRRPRIGGPGHPTAATFGGPRAGSPVPLLATAPDTRVKPVRHGGLEVGRAVEAHVTGVKQDTSRPKAKPPVRKYAKDLGVDLAGVVGTGPDRTITRSDVDTAVQARAGLGLPAGVPTASAPAVAAPAVAPVPAPVSEPAEPVVVPAAPAFDPATREQRIPIKGVRKATAAAMVSSAFTAPHVTEWYTVDVTPMMKVRGKLSSSPEFAGVKVSPLVFVAKALLLAARRHPMVNSSWDDAAQEIVVKDYINLGIAAATPRGLLVPNIKDAGRLSMRELAASIGQLTELARAGKTPPADMGGGTITITNVGVFGIDTGTPILNPGQSAILAFGAIRQQPWVHKGKVKPRYVTTLGLSFDHRIIDGELGSKFLADVGNLLADPSRALTF